MLIAETGAGVIGSNVSAQCFSGSQQVLSYNNSCANA
jgi:hypothetical protein